MASRKGFYVQKKILHLSIGRNIILKMAIFNMAKWAISPWKSEVSKQISKHLFYQSMRQLKWKTP